MRPDFKSHSGIFVICSAAMYPLGRRFACTLLLGVLCFAFEAFSKPPAKVDQAVWDDSEHGKKARFVIILAEQASPLALRTKHKDKTEQRRAAVAELRALADRSQRPLHALLNAHGASFSSFWAANLIAVEGNRGLIEALSHRPEVLLLEADRAFTVKLETPEEAAVAIAPLAIPQGNVEPGIVKVGATNVWNRGILGQGIVYANADTGVEWNHPALRNQYRGWNGTNANHNYHWWDAIHQDLSGNGTNSKGFNAQQPVDDNGHGTHTTGTGIGWDGANNVIGMAPGAKWIACRNMDENVGRPSTYIECLQFFLAPTDLAGNNPDPEKGADVVGNSYGCPPSEQCAPNSLHFVVENMRAAGIFMSVAAGNSGPVCGSIVDPPALEDSVITVGATITATDQITSFSSRGPVGVDGSNRRKPDLVAPGQSVRSAYPGGAYTALSGTSMAAPHVAGGVALLWSAFPHIRGNVDYTESLLLRTAVPLTTSQGCGGDTASVVPNHVFGFGRINVWAAFQAVNLPPLAASTNLSPLGDHSIEFALPVFDPEGSNLTVTVVTPPAKGLLTILNSTTVRYLPAHGFVGADLFTYRVSDGAFSSSNATVQLSVTPPADSDADTIPDYWETQFNFDTAMPTPVTDADGDGMNLREEYLANTNPRDAASVFRILGCRFNAQGQLAIRWSAIGGTRYRLQVKDGATLPFADIPRSVEVELSPVPIGSSIVMEAIVPPEAALSRFYQIRVVQ